MPFGLRFHVQLDVCSHPFLILFGQQGIHQSQATVRVWKQRGDSGSALELFVVAFMTDGAEVRKILAHIGADPPGTAHYPSTRPAAVG